MTSHTQKCLKCVKDKILSFVAKAKESFGFMRRSQNSDAMTDTNPQLPFLVIGENHLSPARARRRVIETLVQCGENEPADGWDKVVVKWKKGDPPFSMTFPEMVEDARKNGIVVHIQRHLDRKDSVFGGTLCDDFCTPNYQITLKTEFGSFKAEVQGPCRTACVEAELTEDILYYRRAACTHSNEYDFARTSRYYRNYLMASISLVDAFINRHIFMAMEDGFTSPEFEELKQTTKIERKVELLWKVCCKEDTAQLFGSVAWCRFQELREKRNALVHAVDPIAIYSLPSIQKYLNKVRSGVGELLLLIRTEHKKPTVGFIERIRTAPLVAYHQVHTRVDGDRVEKIKLD